MQRFVLLSLIIMLAITVCKANTTLTSRSNARQQFIAAEQALQKGAQQTYQDLRAQLTDYPLYPYLIYQDLSQRLTTASSDEILAFIRQYRNTPLANTLHKQWLLTLADQDERSLFLKHYRDFDHAALSCYQLQFRLQRGEPATPIYQAASKLWLHDDFRPNACNPLFEAWRKAGYQTSALIWQRLTLAAKAQNINLMKYLKTLLPSQKHIWVDRWLALTQDPTLIAGASWRTLSSSSASYILHETLQRLAWKNSTLALSVWDEVRLVQPFSAEQKADIIKALAVALATADHPSAERWLKQIPETYVDKSVREWRIRYALRHLNWRGVLQAIAWLPAEEQQELAWQYWKARALIEQKQPEQAQIILQTLAQKRHYYGFLASDYLKQTSALPLYPSIVESKIQSQVTEHPTVLRSYELHLLDRNLASRREWNLLSQQLSTQELQVAAQLAYRYGWYDRAILMLNKMQDEQVVYVRFPLAFKDSLTTTAQQQGIDPALAFAITRQESLFIKDARSPAGALGLMQVLPSTAQEISQQNGWSYQTTALTEPSINLRLGTAYLRQMLKNYQDNPILATAAYNAGPTRVQNWLDANPGLPSDVWIDTIPYKETRNYVKNVLAAQTIYAKQLGLPNNTLQNVSRARISLLTQEPNLSEIPGK